MHTDVSFRWIVITHKAPCDGVGNVMFTRWQPKKQHASSWKPCLFIPQDAISTAMGATRAEHARASAMRDERLRLRPATPRHNHTKNSATKEIKKQRRQPLARRAPNRTAAPPWHAPHRPHRLATHATHATPRRATPPQNQTNHAVRG